MIAVKFCCLNIIEVGNHSHQTPRTRILLNSIPYSQISKGESVYMCINQQIDIIELQWPRNSTIIKKFITPECIKASTIAVTPFWMEFDDNPHFMRMQLKMVLLNKNKENKCVEREKPQLEREKLRGLPMEMNRMEQESESWIDMKGSSMSLALCLESQRTLNDLQHQRQKILQSLFNKIKPSP